MNNSFGSPKKGAGMLAAVGLLALAGVAVAISNGVQQINLQPNVTADTQLAAAEEGTEAEVTKSSSESKGEACVCQNGEIYEPEVDDAGKIASCGLKKGTQKTGTPPQDCTLQFCLPPTPGGEKQCLTTQIKSGGHLDAAKEKLDTEAREKYAGAATELGRAFQDLNDLEKGSSEYQQALTGYNQLYDSFREQRQKIEALGVSDEEANSFEKLESIVDAQRAVLDARAEGGTQENEIERHLRENYPQLDGGDVVRQEPNCIVFNGRLSCDSPQSPPASPDDSDAESGLGGGGFAGVGEEESGSTFQPLTLKQEGKNLEKMAEKSREEKELEKKVLEEAKGPGFWSPVETAKKAYRYLECGFGYFCDPAPELTKTQEELEKVREELRLLEQGIDPSTDDEPNTTESPPDEEEDAPDRKRRDVPDRTGPNYRYPPGGGERDRLEQACLSGNTAACQQLAGRQGAPQQPPSVPQSQRRPQQNACEKWPGTSLNKSTGRCSCPSDQAWTGSKCEDRRQKDDEDDEDTPQNQTALAAELSCAPSVQDVGAPVLISYACRGPEGTQLRSDGFEADGLTGSTSTPASFDESKVDKRVRTFGLTCVKDGETKTDQCTVQVSKPTITAVVKQGTIEAGERADIGWVTTGIKACTLEATDGDGAAVEEFNEINEPVESPSGSVTTPELQENLTVVLTCTTLAGAKKKSDPVVVEVGTVSE